MRKWLLGLWILAAGSGVWAREFHVATTGNDEKSGELSSPFRTIQRGAVAAQAGDTITVHAGVYRERVNPPRGGESDNKRIAYQAATGETVQIKGSEIIKEWSPDRQGIWQVTIPNSFFGKFNPYNDLIKGDWFDPKGRKHHTGAVYLDGQWLIEAADLEELYKSRDPLWYATVDKEKTVIRARFDQADPNRQNVEINVRQTVFYPDQPGRDYITVRGFRMSHAAPQWAPPTAEQMGLIGTHWSRGWIIEDNHISHSINAGISLGKYGDQFDNLAATAKAYNDSIDRALNHGWRKANVGGHLVRNNTISYCEQVGIVGSMGASFSRIIGNHIFKIHVQNRYGGAELAGIKFHAPIDVLIEGNRIHETPRAIWLDWMTQGTRVSRNLCYKSLEDVFLEVNHGPCLVDNNLFLSDTKFVNRSEGGAYVHNLFASRYFSWLDPNRETPYFKAHSTEKAGLAKIVIGDDRFFNNIFVGKNGADPTADINSETIRKGKPVGGRGLFMYEGWPTLPVASGNVYYFGAKPAPQESDFTLCPTDPAIRIEERGDEVFLHITLDPIKPDSPQRLVTSQRLGLAKVSQLPFENPDGTPVVINQDYIGKPRNSLQPSPGPFENPGFGRWVVKVW
jgi:alpha-N-arabinofuranosidase